MCWLCLSLHRRHFRACIHFLGSEINSDFLRPLFKSAAHLGRTGRMNALSIYRRGQKKGRRKMADLIRVLKVSPVKPGPGVSWRPSTLSSELRETWWGEVRWDGVGGTINYNNCCSPSAGWPVARLAMPLTSSTVQANRRGFVIEWPIDHLAWGCAFCKHLVM